MQMRRVEAVRRCKSRHRIRQFPWSGPVGRWLEFSCLDKMLQFHKVRGLGCAAAILSAEGGERFARLVGMSIDIISDEQIDDGYTSLWHRPCLGLSRNAQVRLKIAGAQSSALHCTIDDSGEPKKEGRNYKSRPLLWLWLACRRALPRKNRLRRRRLRRIRLRRPRRQSRQLRQHRLFLPRRQQMAPRD